MGVFHQTAKRVQLLKEVAPGIMRLAYLQNPSGSGRPENWSEVQDGARALGLDAMHLQARTPAEIDAAFAAMAAAGADGLHVAADTLFGSGTDFRVVELALKYHLPSMHSVATYARAGGLMSYAPDDVAMHRRAADYVDRLLKGANPAEMPIEQPTNYNFALNLKTAEGLGLTLPADVAAQVTEWVVRPEAHDD